MKKRRERALHLFELTGRERTVNRLHVDKARQAIVQKRLPLMTKGLSRSGIELRPQRRDALSARPGQCGSMSSGKDSPRNVALREEAKAFALQNRCGAL